MLLSMPLLHLLFLSLPLSVSVLHPVYLSLSPILWKDTRKPQMDKIPIDCRSITRRLKAQNREVFLLAK